MSKPSGLDLSIFPDALRQIVAGHQALFAGARMEEGDDPAPADTPPEPDADATSDDDSDEKLGESGKKALVAERQRAAAAEKANKELTEKVSGFEGKFNALVEALTGKAPESEVTAEDAIAQLTELKNSIEQRDQAAADRARRVEIKAAATAAGFNDPNDALIGADLSTVPVGETGEADSAAAKALVEKLAKAKPYLVKSGTKLPTPGQLGQGNKGANTGTAPGVSRLAAAFQSKP